MSEPETPGGQERPARAFIWMVAAAFISLGLGALMTGDVGQAVTSSLIGIAVFALGLFWHRLVPIIGPRITQTFMHIASDARSWLAVLLVIFLWAGYPMAMVGYGFRTPEEMWPWYALRHVPAQAPQPPLVTARPTPAPPSAAPAPDKQERRILNVDASYLVNLYRDRTQMEADRIFAPYVHKWIKVVGKLEDVTEPSAIDDGYTVFVSIPRSGAQDIRGVLRFNSRWKDRIEVLPYQQDVSALCSIRSASLVHMSFDHCELIDAGHQQK